MIARHQVRRLLFLLSSIAAMWFCPQTLLAIQALGQPLGLNIPRFCPPLPSPSGAVLEVSTVTELVSAVNNAAAGTTILLADGTYALNGDYLRLDAPGVTLRSASGNREAVVLDGNYLTTEIIQIVASNVIIADLTLREAYDHPIHIMSSPGSDTLNTLIYNVHIVDPGQQAVKINPYTQAGAAFFTDNGTVACSHIELTDAGRPHIRDNCYTGGIDAHQSRGWTIRDNLIEGFWCAAGLSEHAVHFWVTSRDTLVERNLLRNNARGVGFGLLDAQGGGARLYGDTPCPGASGGYVDHYGGIIRNNFIYADSSGLFASEDGFDCGLCLWQACGARALHNTVASTQAPFSSIEWRFTNTDVSVINNLVTHNLRERDGATAIQQGNLSGQPLTLFLGNGANGELHLKSSAIVAINKVTAPPDVPRDIDGDQRPAGAQADIGADELSFLEITPLSRVIPAGGQTTFTVTVQAPPGFSGTLNLSAPSPSPQLAVTLAPTSVTPPGQSVMTVRDLHVGPLPSAISYSIPVTAAGTDFIQSVPVQVLVDGSLLYLPLILR
jgi:hypothetical protein